MNPLGLRDVPERLETSPRGCFEAKGFTFKPREAVFGPSGGTPGEGCERMAESALRCPGGDLRAGGLSQRVL